MKYRTDFVTNSSSSSSIFISIETNKQVIDIHYELTNIYMPAFADHTMDSYGVLLKYLFESKIKEYNFNSGRESLIEISGGYIGDIYFLEDEYPENPSEKDMWIKKLCEIYENELNNVSIDSYEEFINHPHLRFLLDLKESEKIVKITETVKNRGDWGQDPKSINSVDLLSFQITHEQDVSDLVESELGDSYNYEWGSLAEEVDLSELWESMIQKFTLDEIHQIRSFYKSFCELLVKAMKTTESDLESYSKFLRNFEVNIDGSRVDTDAHYEDRLIRIFEMFDPLLAQAIEAGVDLRQLVKRALKPTKVTEFSFENVVYAMTIDQNMELFKSLLAGKNINQVRAANNVTLLHMACLNNLTEFALYLIDHSVDVNALTTANKSKQEVPYAMPTEDISALQLACIQSNEIIVNKLLDAGANPNQANKLLYTPLMMAAQRDRVDILRLLIDHEANLEAMRENGETALYLAAKENASNAVRYLVECGSNIDRQTKTFDTPMRNLIMHGNVEMVRFLLKHGANFDYERKYIGLGEMTGFAGLINNGNYSSDMADLLFEQGYPMSAFVDGVHVVVLLEKQNKSDEAQKLAQRLNYDYKNVALFMGDRKPRGADQQALARFTLDFDSKSLRNHFIKKGISLNNYEFLRNGAHFITQSNREVTQEARLKIARLFDFFKQSGASLDMRIDDEKDRRTFLMNILNELSKYSYLWSKEWLIAIAESLVEAGCNVNASDGNSTPLDQVNDRSFIFQVEEPTATHLRSLLLAKGARTYQDYYLESK